MIKKLFLTLASLFLAYRSIELLKIADHSPLHAFNWLASTAYAFTINLFITGVFALLGFAFLTSKMLPNVHYKIKHVPSLTITYNILGVKYFKYLLMLAFWGKETNRKKYFNGTKAGLQHFDTQTRQSEFGHLAAFVTIASVSFHLLFKGGIVVFILSSLINVIGNFYPIVLQRYHRIQIERLQHLQENRKY